MEPESLADFLERKSQEGGKLNSEGEFTISSEKALEKLRESTLSQPADWTLKMVQAAVAGEATAVRFTQRRNQTVVEFSWPEPVEHADLERALLQLKSDSEPRFQELALGLRPQLGGPLTFLYPDQPWMVWDGAQFQPTATQSNLTPGTSFAVCVQHSSSQNRASEALVLQQRALFSPCPVWLDKQRIQPRGEVSPWSGTRRSAGSKPPLAVGTFTAQELEARSLSREPVMAKANYRGRPLENPEPFADWTSPEAAAHFLLFCRWLAPSHFVEPERFSICLTRLGVISALYQVQDAPLGGYLALSGDRFVGDISGLSLRIEPDQAASALAEYQALRPVAVRLLKLIRQYSTRPTLAEAKAHIPNLLGGAGVLGVMGAMAWGPVGLTATIPGIAVGLKALLNSNPDAQLKSAVLRGLEEFRAQPASLRQWRRVF